MTPHRLIVSLLGLASLALLAACDRDRLDVFARPLDTLPAIGITGHVVVVEKNDPAAYVVDVASPELGVARVPLGTDPVLAVARAGHDEVLVLTRGERGRDGVAPEDASLAVVAPGADDAPSRTYRLGSRFNALAQSDDGRFAIAFFDRGDATGSVLVNPNEIAVVDLDADPAETNPVPRTVRSFGGFPNAIVFSPSLPLPEGPRTLAVVLSDQYVTLLDLDHLDRSEITVPLTLPEDAHAVLPEQVVFDTSDPTVYVRARASDDVFALRLGAVPPGERISNDFRPQLSQLAAGRGPADMALFDAPDGRRLLVTSPGSLDARVIDVRSSRVTTIPLGTPAGHILLFSAVAPGDPKPGPRALLLGSGPAVAFLDLEGIEDKTSRNVDVRPLAAGMSHVLPRLDQGQVIVMHGGGGVGLSVIDLGRRTSAPILAELPLSGSSWTVDGERLWVAPKGSDRAAFLELGSYSPGEVRLDTPLAGLVPLPAGDGPAPVVLLHATFGGHLTVLDPLAPDREHARTLRGFLLADLLERRSRT